MGGVIQFSTQCLRTVVRGERTYWLWVIFLLLLAGSGALAYGEQLQEGMVRTNLRDPVSWGLYIGNFTFLVGVAAAAVTLVIPAYLYDWQPLKRVAVFGELLAISAILMSGLFVVVDMGRPERVWHMLPIVGELQFPGSLFAWDLCALGAYFILNAVGASHLLYCAYRRRPYWKRFVHTLMVVSIPLAVAIHTVTAFIYGGLAARHAWHTAILAPQFLASAFCSGLAVLVILFQLLQRTTALRLEDRAIQKMGELMAYSLAVYLFMLGGGDLHGVLRGHP